MFCPQCGVEVTDDSKYCFKCGKDIPRESPPPVNHAPPNDVRAAFPEQPVSAAVPSHPPKPQSTRRRTWTTVAAVFFLFAMYFNVIAGAFSGVEFYTKGRDQLYVLFFGGLFFWWLFKSYGRNKWVGGILGVVLSFVVLVAGVVIDKRTKGSVEYVMEHTPQIAAVKKNHPYEYAQIAKELEGLAAKGAKPEEYPSLLNSRLTPITLKAVHSTSDAAIFEYGRTKLLMLRDVAANNADDCVMLMSGEAQNATPAVSSHIFSAMSEETKTASRKAIGRVIEDEGMGRFEQENADARFEQLYRLIDDKLKLAGTSAFYFMDETKSADVRCKSGLGVYGEVMSLPVADRSFMLRRMFIPR